MLKCHECQPDFGATGAAALQAPSQGLWGDCQHQNTDTVLPSHSTNSDLCAPQAALLPLSPAKDMVLPLLRTPRLPGRHKAESTASHRGAGCSECRSSEQAAAEAAGCPVLPGQDLARYQGNIVMRKLFLMVVTQSWKLPHELQFSARSLCGQRVFWLSATTKPPIPPHNSRKRRVLSKEAFSPSLF